MFLDTMKYSHMKTIMHGQETLKVTKFYTYLGLIMTDSLCDEADIKAKIGYISRSVASCDAAAMSSLVHSFKSWNHGRCPANNAPLGQRCIMVTMVAV